MDRQLVEQCMREAIALAHRLSEALNYSNLSCLDAQRELSSADDHLITINAIL